MAGALETVDEIGFRGSVTLLTSVWGTERKYPSLKETVFAAVETIDFEVFGLKNDFVLECVFLSWHTSF